MTERQAWLLIAKAWDKPRVFTDDGVLIYFATIWKYKYCGLCPCVYVMEENERIDEFTRNSMLTKIESETRKKGAHHPFIWPTTLSGAYQRAAFCRKQAAKLTKKRKKK